jgi:hypothetical protein
VAGVHLSGPDATTNDSRAARERLGPGCRLLRVATWDEGLALAPGVVLKSIDADRLSRLRWVGRERPLLPR